MNYLLIHRYSFTTDITTSVIPLYCSLQVVQHQCNSWKNDLRKTCLRWFFFFFLFNYDHKALIPCCIFISFVLVIFLWFWIINENLISDHHNFINNGLFGLYFHSEMSFNCCKRSTNTMHRYYVIWGFLKFKI